MPITEKVLDPQGGKSLPHGAGRLLRSPVQALPVLGAQAELGRTLSQQAHHVDGWLAGGWLLPSEGLSGHLVTCDTSTS